jgi:hypothetical protein
MLLASVIGYFLLASFALSEPLPKQNPGIPKLKGNNFIG